MRVMTWNLWWQFGPWEKRQPGIAAVVADMAPDILCLQEVWGTETDGVVSYQARQLADELGDYNVAPPSLRFREGRAFTNAIVSRWPIVDTFVVRLPTGDGSLSFRTAVFAEIETHFGIQPVVTAHIAHKGQDDADRLAQTVALGDLIRDRRAEIPEALPALLAGDFNAEPEDPELVALCGTPGDSDSAPAPLLDAWVLSGQDDPGLTWSTENPYATNAKWPNRRLDYVLVEQMDERPATVKAAGLAGTDPMDGVVPSDHYAVWVDFDLSP